PIGRRLASTPRSIACSTSGQVIRSRNRSATRRSSQRPCDTREMEGFAQVDGVNLWYELSGEGEPVVQIHGAGFGHFNFAPATPELAQHFRVIDYDMRGYGRSARPAQ